MTTATYRPGLKACNELGVKHPLADAGMNKQAVRELSKELGNANWARPASALPRLTSSLRPPSGSWFIKKSRCG